jgi:hypothetical protein
MRNPTIEVQKKKLFPYLKNLDEMVEAAHKRLSRYPYEIINTEALENQVKNIKYKLIDIELIPFDFSVYNTLNSYLFDVIIHWRCPKEFMSIDYGQVLLEWSIF